MLIAPAAGAPSRAPCRYDYSSGGMGRGAGGRAGFVPIANRRRSSMISGRYAQRLTIAARNSFSSGRDAMNHVKQSKPNHRIHEVLSRRWSPYAFADRPVSRGRFALVVRGDSLGRVIVQRAALELYRGEQGRFPAVCPGPLLPGRSQSGLGEQCAGTGLGVHQFELFPQRQTQCGGRARPGPGGGQSVCARPPHAACGCTR